MGLAAKLNSLISKYGVKVYILVAIIFITVGFFARAVIGGLIDPKTEVEAPQVVQEASPAYINYQETGVDMTEINNYADTGQQLPEGFHIIGEYNSDYNQLSGFVGFYADEDERYQVSGVEGTSEIIYVDNQGTQHIVEGSELSDLQAVQGS